MPENTSFFKNPESYVNPPFKSADGISGLKVTVMGLGLHGGGTASARFFAEHGAVVTVTDMKTEKELAPSIQALSDYPGIKFVLGEHRKEDFANTDLVIKNPGVKLEENPFLELASSIETDISVFLRLSRAEIIAVTGSKGKSSTASAIYFGLKHAGKKAFLGGNITVSPLSFLTETGADSTVVLELSSWQLADLRGRGILKPKCAVITPVMPDHQNWYGSMEAYVADKKLIYADMPESSRLICNFDDGWGRIFAKETRAAVNWYSANPFPAESEIKNGAWLEKDGGFLIQDGNISRILPEETKVPGKHMKMNLLNAGQVLSVCGVKSGVIMEAAEAFPGIAHRLEFFHEENGVKWFNDSAATIPEAAAGAVYAFENPVILLCGGTDKNLDFSPIAEAAGKTKKLLLLEGSGTRKLRELLEAGDIKYEGPYPDIKSLVSAARNSAAPGDSVVFSPGCASFELFKNEFDRGNKFKNEVLDS